MQITSTTNPKVKQLIQWQKKRKAREADQVFLAEGIRMVSETPIERIRELYVSESFAGKPEAERLPDVPKEKCFTLSDKVFSHVSETQTPQGVLCVVERRCYTLEEILEVQAPLLMVLETLQDPGNLGTILRAGEAAGVTGIVMSRDCADIYNPKVIRSTMGALYRMPHLYVDSVSDTLQLLKERGIRSYAAHLDGENSYDKEDYTTGTAFLIGNEGNGLTEETAKAADRYIKIPMCGQVESLNAAVAASVLMFEAARQRRNL